MSYESQFSKESTEANVANATTTVSKAMEADLAEIFGPRAKEKAMSVATNNDLPKPVDNSQPAEEQKYYKGKQIPWGGPPSRPRG